MWVGQTDELTCIELVFPQLAVHKLLTHVHLQYTTTLIGMHDDALYTFRMDYMQASTYIVH